MWEIKVTFVPHVAKSMNRPAQDITYSISSPTL